MFSALSKNKGDDLKPSRGIASFIPPRFSHPLQADVVGTDFTGARRLAETLNLTEAHPGGLSSSPLVILPTAALSLHRRGNASR